MEDRPTTEDLNKQADIMEQQVRRSGLLILCSRNTLDKTSEDKETIKKCKPYFLPFRQVIFSKHGILSETLTGPVLTFSIAVDPMETDQNKDQL